ncbi:MAG: glycosyltransferase [Acidimicrobiia bacterium]
MKPHLVYIAFWYPPSRASGVYRALATTRAFIDAGWDVTVITTTEEFLEDEIGSTDESLVTLIPVDVEVVRVPFSFGPRGDVDVRSLGWWRANYPSVWTFLHRKIGPARTALAVLRGVAPEAHQFSDNYVSWVDPVVKAGLKIGSNKTVDHVLATGNPFSAFEAARLIGGLIGSPFSIDYRDPWTMDVFTGSLEHADRATTEVERRIIDEAALCFHVNPAIADAYRAKYPASSHKHRVVYNGYDADSIPHFPPKPPGPVSGPLRFGILGTVNDRWPLEPIFDAWISTRPELPMGSTLVLGGYLGYFARSQDLLEAYLPEEAMGFRYLGPVPKSEVADFYSSLDVVVLPVPGGPMVTSGKVFEALALGKPVVCVQAEGGGARVLLQGNPLGFGAEPDTASVGEALIGAASAARSPNPDISNTMRAEALRYERHRAIGEMVTAVEGLRSQVQAV